MNIASVLNPATIISLVTFLAASTGILVIFGFLLLGILTRTIYYCFLLIELLINSLRKKINKKTTLSSFVFLYFNPIFSSNNNELILKIIGVSLISSLAFAANNWFVYTICIIITATLIAPIEFLEKLMAIIFSGKDYFYYLTETAKQTQQKNLQENAPPIQLGSNNTFDYQKLFYYEATYRLIFGSQIEILLSMESEKSINIDKIIETYNKTQWQKIGYQFAHYLNFLLRISSLINFDSENNNYHLSKLGLDFLEYLRTEKIPLKKEPY